MQKSRKGTRLNDAQYFRQPLPHTRRRMTKLRVLPLNPDRPQEREEPPKKYGCHSRTLDRDQPSAEVSCISFSERRRKSVSEDNALEKCEEVVPEIQPDAEIPEASSPECLEVKPEEALAEIEHQEPVEVTFEAEPDNLSRETVVVESEQPIVTRGDEIKPPNRREAVEERPPSSSWWRIILDFFIFFFGRRESQEKARRMKMKKAEKSLIQARPENANIHEVYMSALGKEKLEEKVRELGRDLRAQSLEYRHYRRDEKIRTRQMSCPLY